MKYYSYENFKNDVNSMLVEFKEFQPDSIVGIARGGLTLAHVVAEGLNIRKVDTIRTELYDNKSRRESIKIFGDCNFKDIKKVLVLDDISDSGETLRAVMKQLRESNPHVEFKTGTIFYKDSSCFEPDYWLNKADDWIEFFWERDFT